MRQRVQGVVAFLALVWFLVACDADVESTRLVVILAHGHEAGPVAAWLVARYGLIGGLVVGKGILALVLLVALRLITPASGYPLRVVAAWLLGAAALMTSVVAAVNMTTLALALR